MNDKAPPVIGSITFDPSRPWHPAPPERRSTGVQPATEAQLDAVAADYAATMRARGFDVPEGNMPVLRRAAAVQDAWRCAFARVVGP